MLIHQELRLGPGGIVRLRNVTDDACEARLAHERRREHCEAGNPKGWSEGRTLQHIATAVPVDDPLIREYLDLRSAGNREEATRVLRVFLRMNPQFRASEARI